MNRIAWWRLVRRLSLRAARIGDVMAWVAWRAEEQENAAREQRWRAERGGDGKGRRG